MRSSWIIELEGKAGIVIQSVRSLSGGDIADAYLLKTRKDNFVVKTLTQPDALPMFSAEQAGLLALDNHPSIRIPEVFGVYQLQGRAALLLEYIEPKPPGKSEWRLFGSSLAELQKEEQDYFGWQQNNFIGRFPQSNRQHHSWLAFYIQERLMPQLQRAQTQAYLNDKECPSTEQLTSMLEPYFREVYPSLLHGDLWNGNFLFDQNGKPCLLDPATYYGHYEVDLAMSHLFGGFHSAFYEAYLSEMPVQSGSDCRREIYQLYYLLVHLNLFGRAYYPSVKRILEKYFT